MENALEENSMDALFEPSLAAQPIDESVLANQLFSTVMLPSRPLYLTSGTNYFIHVRGAYVDHKDLY